MKIYLGFIFVLTLYCCSEKDQGENKEYSSNEYRDITQNLSKLEFEVIKNFILQNGDKQTYCNMYNYNPHYSFDIIESYLNPEIGQKNINCDPKISDFNEIVLRIQRADPQYYTMQIVRKGDIKNKNIFFVAPTGIKEEKVYLQKYYDYNLDTMENKLYGYLKLIRNEINSH